MGIRPNYYIRWQQYGKTKPESARGESGEIFAIAVYTHVCVAKSVD
jgi:hypothetical protein